MQVPKRKGEEQACRKIDPVITQKKYRELKAKLEKIKAKLPVARKEVSRLAEMGDFSENTAYQMAKGRLRGMNAIIEKLQDQLKKAQVISSGLNNDMVRVGHTVKLKINGQKKIFQILGSEETNPTVGIISRNSPLGSQLLGARIGQELELDLAGRKVKGQVLKIIG